MTEKTLNTRIILKNDTLDAWEASSLILKKGEIALASVSSKSTGDYDVPTYLMKVGDGKQIFSKLNWIVANAADVYDWAKQSTFPIEVAGAAPRSAANGISNIEFKSTTSHPAGALVITYASFDASGSAEAAQKAAEKVANELNTAMNGRVEILEAAIGEGGSVDTQIQNKLDALNASAVTAGDGEVISEVSQSKGTVTIKKKTLAEKDIPALSLNKITGLETALSEKEKAGAAATALESAKNDAATKYAKISHDHVAADITDLDTTIKSYKYATQTEAQGYANAKDKEIAAAKSIATQAQSEVDALEALVGTIPEGASSTSVIDYVGEKIGEIPTQTDYSISVAESTPEGSAKSYAFSQCGKVITTINIPKDMVVESGKVVTNPAGQAPGTYIELTLANKKSSKLYINVGNLIEYVTSGSAPEDQIVVNVSEDHKVTATLAEGSVTLAQLNVDVQASINKAHSHANSKVLDSITSDKVTAWDGMETKANGYTDSAIQALTDGAIADNATAISQEVQRATGEEQKLSKQIEALSGSNHSHSNKDTLDTISAEKVAAWDGAVSAKHTHSNIEELNKIASGDKAKWDAAEQNAKTYADGLGKNYATIAQGEKADSALQAVKTATNCGLKVTGKDTIDFDETITFVFDCGTSVEIK